MPAPYLQWCRKCIIFAKFAANLASYLKNDAETAPFKGAMLDEVSKQHVQYPKIRFRFNAHFSWVDEQTL